LIKNKNKYIFINGSTTEVLTHTKSDRDLCQSEKTKQALVCVLRNRSY